MAEPYVPYRDEFTRSEIALLFGVLVLAIQGLGKRDERIDAIAEYYGIEPSWAAETVATAKTLGMDPWWLAAVISFESQWVPDIKNPRSSATGLIQFVEPTARSLGTTTAAIADMSVRQQFRLIARYFGKSFSGRSTYPTLQSVAMQVFYPAARSWPRSREFPFDQATADANRSIVTVGDYMRRVEQRLPGSMRPRASEPVSEPIDVSFS
jgi:hypothetical protein